MTPEELRYTEEHEWIRVEGQRATVGITDYAQDALGDVVYVDLPASGTRVEKGQPFGEVESTKSVSDIYAPVAGEVVEVNENLANEPETVNASPYEGAWMVKLRLAGPADSPDLLSADEYEQHIAAGGH